VANRLRIGPWLGALRRAAGSTAHRVHPKVARASVKEKGRVNPLSRILLAETTRSGGGPITTQIKAHIIKVPSGVPLEVRAAWHGRLTTVLYLCQYCRHSALIRQRPSGVCSVFLVKMTRETERSGIGEGEEERRENVPLYWACTGVYWACWACCRVRCGPKIVLPI